MMTFARTSRSLIGRPFVRVTRPALLLALSLLFWSGCSEEKAAETPAPAEAGAGADAAAAAPAAGHDPAGGPPGMPGMPGMPGGADAMAAGANPAAEPAAEPTTPGKAPFDTTYLDVDTEVFVFARVADVLKSSLVQTLTRGNLGPLDEMKREVGVDPRDVESVTIGVRNLKKLAEKYEKAAAELQAGQGPGQPGGMGGMDATITPPAGAGIGGAPPPMQLADKPGGPQLGIGGVSNAPPPPPPGSLAERMQELVVVLRLSSPVDMQIFEGEGAQQIPRGDKAYYKLTSPLGETLLVYVPDPQTLVVAEEGAIWQMIDLGADRPRPTADLGFIETAPHFLLAAVPKDKSMFRERNSMMAGLGAGPFPGGPPGAPIVGRPVAGPPGAPPPMMMTQPAAAGGHDKEETAPANAPIDATTVDQHLEASALLVDLSAGTGLQAVVKCDSPEAAKVIQELMEKSALELRTGWDNAKSSLPGIVKQVVDPVVDSLKVQTTESAVAMSATLPEEQQASLSMLPALVMGMMMTGGMNLDAASFDMEPPREVVNQEVLDGGQPAANAAELPEGLEVKGMLRWGKSKYGDQAPAPLELNVVAVGGPAANTVGIGKLTLTDAKAGDTASLKWEGVATGASEGDPVDGFVPITREGMSLDHPDEGVAVGFEIVPPADPAKALASVTGQFTMQVPASGEEVLVTNVADLPDGVVKNQELDQARMIATFDSQDRLAVTYSDSSLFMTIEPVTADGSPVANSKTNRSHGGGSTSLVFTFDETVPADLTLRVTTYSDLQEVVVPFRFENLPLPEAQTLTDEQRSLLVWTRGESPADQPDLIIEAQSRWQTLELASTGVGATGEAAPNGLGAAFGGGFGFGAGGGAGASPMTGPTGVPAVGGAVPPGANLPGTGGPGASGRRNDDDKKDRGRGAGQPGLAVPPAGGIPGGAPLGGAALGGAPLGGAALGGVPLGGGALGGAPAGGGLLGGVPPDAGDFGGGGFATATSDQPLQIVIDLIGPLADAAEAVGELNVSSVKSDLDTVVEFEGAEIQSVSGNPVSEFVELDQEGRSAGAHPPHGLRLIVKLTPPQTPIGGLALLSGSVTLRTVREQSVAILSDLPSRVGKPEAGEQIAVKPVNDRELLKHGLKPVVGIEANRVMMRLLEGKDEKISEVTLLDLNGKPITDVYAATEAGTPQTKGHTIYTFDFANGVPQKIGMKIAVNLGIKDVKIPIRIKNLPVPPTP